MSEIKLLFGKIKIPISQENWQTAEYNSIELRLISPDVKLDFCPDVKDPLLQIKSNIDE